MAVLGGLGVKPSLALKLFYIAQNTSDACISPHDPVADMQTMRMHAMLMTTPM